MEILRTPDDRFADLPDYPEKPLLCCFSDQDPVTKGGEKPFMKLVPGAQGRPHRTIEGGGHFLQEDCGPELAHIIDEFIAST